MGNQYRKLLPYEHQLINSLGITKEQYLDFVVQQQEYVDIKENTILDVRNAEATVALVLAIVGALAQVASVFLTPRPQVPAATTPPGQRQQTRDDRFAPRFGFNTVQELAKYGDPVNLIYANTSTNADGGVRAATALLWSSVKSFGSSQYVQMLLLLGAGAVGAIDATRTAFGQTPLRDLIAQNYWLYFRANDTGPIRGNDRLAGGNSEDDPVTANVGSRNLYRLVPSSGDSSGDGFSHALSPASSNQFGIYAPVPINVDISLRNEAGSLTFTNNRIDAYADGRWGSGNPGTSLSQINVGDSLQVIVRSTADQASRGVAEEAADQRRAVASAFDNAGIFKLGSAMFTVVSVNRGSTDEGDMVVTLRCIEAGLSPSSPYNTTRANTNAQDLANADPVYTTLRQRVQNLLNEDERTNITSASDLLRVGNIFRFPPPPPPPPNRGTRARGVSTTQSIRIGRR